MGRFLWVGLIAVLSCLMVGIASGPAAAPHSPAKATKSGVKASTGKAVATKPSTPSDSEPSDRDEGAADQESSADARADDKTMPMADLDGPFPHRVNPFELPEEPVAIAGKPEDKTHPEVKVLGFTNVDRQKAIIEINGMTAALAVGERLEQVEVTEINPPVVSFEFRRLPWKVSIFDEPEKPEHRPGTPHRSPVAVRAGVVRTGVVGTPPTDSSAHDRRPSVSPGTSQPTGTSTRGASPLSGSPTRPATTTALPTSLPTTPTSPASASPSVPAIPATERSNPAGRASDAAAQTSPSPTAPSSTGIPPRLGVPAGLNAKNTLSPSSVPEVTRRLPPSTLTDSRKP